MILASAHHKNSSSFTQLPNWHLISLLTWEFR